MTKTFLVTLAVGLAGTTISSQTPAASAQFEVASVKPNTSTIPKSGIQAQPGGRFIATSVTLRQLIEYAYQLQDVQIAGGPGRLTSDRFDILARAEDAASAMGLPPIDADGASIFTAVREQLGLKLESQKGPVEVLVVDRAEHPTYN